MCIQSEEQVAEEVRKIVKEHKIKSIFVGTDHFPMEDHLKEEMKRLEEMEEGWDFEVSSQLVNITRIFQNVLCGVNLHFRADTGLCSFYFASDITFLA